MICTYLNISPENFLRNRPNGEPTIVDQYDPVQFMIPTPKTSHVIETMDKNLCAEILRWVVPTASKKIKDNIETVKNVSRNQMQAVFHFLIEDMLWLEHDIDFEDYK